MNVEALQIIELDAARAPAPMVDHYIQLVRNSLAECTADTAEYANALLLKLEHLASHQRVHAIDSSQTQVYLAPWLTIPSPSLRDAAGSSTRGPFDASCIERLPAVSASRCDERLIPRTPCDRHGCDLPRPRIKQVPTRLRLHQPERGALPPVGVVAPFSHNKKGPVVWQLARRNTRPRASSVAA